MMPWVYLIMAGGLEIGWAVALKASDGFSRPLPAALGLAMAGLSLLLLSLALRSMAVSQAYPIWVGIGVAGVAAYGAIFLGEVLSPLKVASIILIGLGVAGLASMEH